MTLPAVAGASTVCEPELDKVPLQPLPAVHVAVLLLDQVSVAAAPADTDVGAIDSFTVGGMDAGELLYELPPHALSANVRSRTESWRDCAPTRCESFGILRTTWPPFEKLRWISDGRASLPELGTALSSHA